MPNVTACNRASLVIGSRDDRASMFAPDWQEKGYVAARQWCCCDALPEAQLVIDDERLCYPAKHCTHPTAE